MKIIGHRGAKGLAPENTILSIRVAMREKVDMIELDLRVKNGKIVLSHDEVGADSRYPSLKEALKKINSKVALNLEIKEPEVLPLLKRDLKGYKGKIVFSSSNYKILQVVRNIYPKAEIAVIEKWSGVRAVTKASLLKTNRIHINHKVVWSKFIRALKHKGYDVYPYTVNHRDRAEELQEWGVDGIFTDYPNLFN